MDYCNNCDQWVTGYTLTQRSGDEEVEVCGFCGHEVSSYPEERPGWELTGEDL